MRRFLPAILAILFLVRAEAQEAAESALRITAAEFSRRREELGKRLNGAAVILDAGPIRGIDNGGRPDMFDFKYLAGAHDDQGILVLADGKTTVFAGDPAKCAPPGAGAVLPVADFAAWAEKNLAGPQKVYTKLRQANLDALVAAAPKADLVRGGLNRELVRLRLVKGPAELRLMKKAADATNRGHLAAMKAVKPGRNEKEIQEIIEKTFRAEGCPELGFPTICGSGRNGTVLHYNKNNQEIAKDTLLVIDIGASIENYVTDITRTLPTSGKFSGEQLKHYRCVLDAQKAAEALLKPGLTMRQLDLAARKVFEDRDLTKWSYGHSHDGSVTHGLGHFVGMYVHDSGGYDEKFRPGMVITIEPGWYDKDAGYGIRIEDIYLVTDDGFERLSAGAPREPEEVEKAMAGRKEF